MHAWYLGQPTYPFLLWGTLSTTFQVFPDSMLSPCYHEREQLEILTVLSTEKIVEM